jgi:hypothetical protein
MIRQEIRELKTGTRELRNFGLLVGAVLVALGLLFLMRGKARYPYFVGPGVLLLVFGSVFPRALKYIYFAWMSLAIVLGFVVSTVILTLFFLLVITPIGLAARLFGKDFLRLKLDRGQATYWISRKGRPRRSPEDYGQQF